MITKINTGNTIGIKRELDDLNRVVIPMEFIKSQNLKSRKVAMFALKDGIYMEFDKQKEEQ